LEVKQVIIHQGVRGIAGSFTNLSVQDAKIADMLWHGVSIVQVKGPINFVDSVVQLCLGIGYYINNTTTGPGEISLLNSTFGLNSGGGILISGNAKPVLVTKCSISNNRYAGIRLTGVGLAAICHNLINFTQPRLSDGSFGDGIVAECSENVIICQDNQNFALDYLPPAIAYNARVGVSFFGSNVSLTNVKLECNTIDLEKEDGSFSGCPNHPTSIDDAGGNVCGCDGATVACQTKSFDVAPPEFPLP
jgi:parallel beta helix pectate lyase-like protein